uniref:(northern house mosquito) hypothetical protein n=1 Tax=Culex pipiens TaxID=7175 RepID=A0A8D8NGY1_CULPI
MLFPARVLIVGIVEDHLRFAAAVALFEVSLELLSGTAASEGIGRGASSGFAFSLMAGLTQEYLVGSAGGFVGPVVIVAILKTGSGSGSGGLGCSGGSGGGSAKTSTSGVTTAAFSTTVGGTTMGHAQAKTGCVSSAGSKACEFGGGGTGNGGGGTLNTLGTSGAVTVDTDAASSSSCPNPAGTAPKLARAPFQDHLKAGLTVGAAFFVLATTGTMTSFFDGPLLLLGVGSGSGTAIATGGASSGLGLGAFNSRSRLPLFGNGNVSTGWLLKNAISLAISGETISRNVGLTAATLATGAPNDSPNCG